MVTFRLLLAISTIKRWPMLQLYINNAFLNGDLHEEVYMTLPKGLIVPSSTCAGPLVCKLHKSIYGLKQSSRQWYRKLSDALIAEGFTQSQTDYTLFTRGHDQHFIALLVYVDDIIITSPNIQNLQHLQASLHKQFRLKALGTLKYFLSFEIARSTTGLFLSQRQYTLQLLEGTGYLGSKPSCTPMEPRLKLSAETGELLTDPTQYRRLIGRLLYLTLSRPDITYSVHCLSQFMLAPRTPHLQAIHHLLQYLKGTPGQGLLYSPTSSLHLRGFSDSDWASYPNTRRSTTGFCIFISDSLVSWRTKKQPTISQSSAEAEYRALAATASEITWLQYLLRDLHVLNNTLTFIYCDNSSAIHITNNPTFHERTKHIELDCHFIRDKIRDSSIRLIPISSHLQLADAFTKALPSTALNSHISKMTVHNIYSPS
ncbi:uncharacterized mitochondrial protein AtMg00810-like [Humulus lupulus]|uniref:uncharacterized mitochondrial protein AtMg00810-like n=1 Tax=Humulus lupulus TaxID=3486 RepID=UPI002B409D4D|nr:uncharacterized mitochondrial protein AtMg00810-like [Humulus lupulus]